MTQTPGPRTDHNPTYPSASQQRDALIAASSLTPHAQDTSKLFPDQVGAGVMHDSRPVPGRFSSAKQDSFSSPRKGFAQDTSNALLMRVGGSGDLDRPVTTDFFTSELSGDHAVFQPDASGTLPGTSGFYPTKQGTFATSQPLAWRSIMNWIKTHQPQVAGLLALCGALLYAASALLDGDPKTTINWDMILTAVAALGLVKARQNNVTSEEAGATTAQAKREITAALKAEDQRTQSRDLPLPGVALMLLFLGGVLLTGCTTPNNASITGKGDVHVATGLQSIATLGQQGQMTAAFNGAAPTQLNQDTGGTYMQTQGAGGWITFNPATSAVMLWSPKDTIIEGLTITPDPTKGQPSLKADRITANITNVAQVYADQFVKVAAVIADMSKAEAQARVDAMVAAGTITREVADAVMTAMYPATAVTAATSATTTVLPAVDAATATDASTLNP